MRRPVLRRITGETGGIRAGKGPCKEIYHKFGRPKEKGVLINRILVTSSTDGLKKLSNDLFTDLGQIERNRRSHVEIEELGQQLKMRKLEGCNG
jgi:hypothetical protein